MQAAEVWRVELRRRTPEGWKRTGWDARTFVSEFVSRASGTVARRDLLDLPRQDFAREWGLPDDA